MQIDKHDEFVPGVTRIKYGGAYTDEEDFKAIQSVLDRNWWTIDEQNTLLEKEIAEFCQSKYSVVVNSGSSALLTGIAALKDLEGWADDSEIITGAVHFPTAITSLYYNRLKPVFVDVEDRTLGINVDLIEQAITDKTVAILAVNIAGSMPDYESLMKLLLKHKDKHIQLIIDNCDGFGGTLFGRSIEKIGTITCTSFHAAHIMAMGEGGAVVTDDVNIADVTRSLREWGRMGDTDKNTKFADIPEDYPGRYIFQYMGFNLKPIEAQSAMGRTQLRKVSIIKKLRQKNYTIIENIIRKSGLLTTDKIQILKQYMGAEPSWFAFPLFAKNRAVLRAFLEARQIETRTIFGGNITKQPAFRDFGRIASDLPISDRVMKQGMFVSVHPACTQEMMEYVGNSIVEFYAH